jgi:hypothetical protein
MTRARRLTLVSMVSFAGWGLGLACGGAQAIDVTAPDDSGGSADWGETDPVTDEGKGGEGKKEDAWDPCFQKKCGTECTQCSPADEDCDELQVLKQCTSDGECVIAPAACAAEKPKATPKKKAAPKKK